MTAMMVRLERRVPRFGTIVKWIDVSEIVSFETRVEPNRAGEMEIVDGCVVVDRLGREFATDATPEELFGALGAGGETQEEEIDGDDDAADAHAG